jgi:hypothetical protein
MQKMADGMSANVHYGFGDSKTKFGVDASENVFTAIPYGASMTPMNGSRFTDLELRAVLTHRAYEYSIIERRTFRAVDVTKVSFV